MQDQCTLAQSRPASSCNWPGAAGFTCWTGWAQVLPFFEGLGFQLPERKGIADFLQEVTSLKDQEQYWRCVAGTLECLYSTNPRRAYCHVGSGLVTFWKRGS